MLDTSINQTFMGQQQERTSKNHNLIHPISKQHLCANNDVSANNTFFLFVPNIVSLSYSMYEPFMDCSLLSETLEYNQLLLKSETKLEMLRYVLGIHVYGKPDTQILFGWFLYGWILKATSGGNHKKIFYLFSSVLL
jgi:hypothetical protein